MFFLTTLEPVWYGHFVLTQIALGQSHPFQSYWWWYACAEEAVC